MFDRIRTAVLRFARVPHDPVSPSGGPGTLRVFRASRRFYHLRLIHWSVGQVGALAGIVFSLMFIHRLERAYNETRAQLAAESIATPAASGAPATPAARDDAIEAPQPESPRPGSKRGRQGSRERAEARMRNLARDTPPWVFPLVTFFELGGILVYLCQIPVTWMMVRLDYELRWYMVTDRSLRIRSGLTFVLESTMSFANVQHVVITRGPIQRLLGIADVRVQSAGGGGGGEQGAEDSLHTGVFHGVDNAAEIRDLILERLRHFRESGLGDPDETGSAPALTRRGAASGAAVAAASQELLAEAKALNLAVRRRTG